MSKVTKSPEICFIVSPIGKSESPTRLRADEVLEFIIRPALEETGYKGIRADAIVEPGVITTDMINHLLEAPLVIADLTEHNPNVYYEIGVRHSFNKPVILISEETDTPFDLQTVRTIHFNHKSLTSANHCKRQIIEQIKAIKEDSKKLTNPISQVATFQAFEHSDQPIEQMMYQLQDQITRMNLHLRQIERNTSRSYVDNPAAFFANTPLSENVWSDKARQILRHEIESRKGQLSPDIERYVYRLLDSNVPLDPSEISLIFKQNLEDSDYKSNEKNDGFIMDE
ncbi:MAG: hypothetical protein GC179_07920 [Anaerolineaceae bacterium]|nr:hypothetical protein [Anaerolineaceae bacterium]